MLSSRAVTSTGCGVRPGRFAVTTRVLTTRALTSSFIRVTDPEAISGGPGTATPGS